MVESAEEEEEECSESASLPESESDIFVLVGIRLVCFVSVVR